MALLEDEVVSMMADAQLTTDPKKARIKRNPVGNRKAILDAATLEFSANGFGGASVNKIAERAGTSKRMLYHYYGNKDALFLAVLEAAYADIRQAERELDLEMVDPIESITSLVTFTWDYYLNNPHFLSLLNDENLHKAEHLKNSKRIMTLHSPFIEMLRRIVESGEKEGVFRSGVDPVDLYLSIAGVSYFYCSNIHTLTVVFGRDLASKEALQSRRNHVVDVILGYLRA